MFLGRFHLQRHPDVEIRGRKKGHMRERMQVNGHAGKTRSEAGATPLCRKIAAPVPAGFGGHSRLLLLEIAARVLAA
jgi:hypothetical protein